MKKIISLFQRNYDGDRLVRDEVVPGAEWVLNGEGIPTRKFDGTCCMIRNEKMYKRYDLKSGKKHPDGFEPAQEPDKNTGKCPGWVPVGSGPEDKWFFEGLKNSGPLGEGTYELVGPKVQGNPEKFSEHKLIKHSEAPVLDAPRKFNELRNWFVGKDLEGIVWHHPDGRMVKIKKKDFGLKRGS